MHPELQENGKWRWPFFTGVPNRRWQYPAWEDLDPQDRADVTEAVERALVVVPWRVVDIELWGSRAFGCAHLMSDFDFNVVATPLLADYYGTEWWWDLTNKLNEASHVLDVRIEAAPVAPSQKRNNIVFSVRDDCFYGKKWGERIRTRRRWDASRRTWTPAPLRTHAHQGG